MTVLRTFQIPDRVVDHVQDKALGERMVASWRKEGVFEIQLTADQAQAASIAVAHSRGFFSRPLRDKLPRISDLSYSGYTARHEASSVLCSETFAVCQDVPLEDPRVRAGWPCHGPVPWPEDAARTAWGEFMQVADSISHGVLQLITLGLGMPMCALTALTRGRLASPVPYSLSQGGDGVRSDNARAHGPRICHDVPA